MTTGQEIQANIFARLSIIGYAPNHGLTVWPDDGTYKFNDKAEAKKFFIGGAIPEDGTTEFDMSALENEIRDAYNFAHEYFMNNADDDDSAEDVEMDWCDFESHCFASAGDSGFENAEASGTPGGGGFITGTESIVRFYADIGFSAFFHGVSQDGNYFISEDYTDFKDVDDALFYIEDVRNGNAA